MLEHTIEEYTLAKTYMRNTKGQGFLAWYQLVSRFHPRTVMDNTLSMQKLVMQYTYLNDNKILEQVCRPAPCVMVGVRRVALLAKMVHGQPTLLALLIAAAAVAHD